jgi:hypothetical protein
MSDQIETRDTTSDPQSIEDELDAALAALDSEPLPTTTLPEPLPLAEEAMGEPMAPPFTPAPSTGSPTLDALDEYRRPKAYTVCERCPNSVWFASPAEVKCYCRVMFLVTWSSKEPSEITNCDGEFLGQAQG